MKKFSIILAVFLMLMLTMGLVVGCGGQDEGSSQNETNQSSSEKQEPAKEEVKDVSLRIGTAGTGGAFYPIGGALAEVISHMDHVSAAAEVTGGSVENIRRMGMGELDLAFAMGDATYQGYTGTGNQFSKTGAMDNIRVLTNIYSNAVHFVTLENSGLKTLDDLKGKRVAVGSPGSGTELKAKALLEIAGLTYDDFEEEFVTFNEAAQGMKDKQIDAAVISVGLPGAAIIDLATSKDIYLIPTTKDYEAKVAEELPFFQPGVIPAGTYPGQDEDVPALYIKGQILIRDDFDEDFVYNLTRHIYENLEGWTQVHQAAKEITLEGAAPAPIPLHPGAEKYYKEMGVIK